MTARLGLVTVLFNSPEVLPAFFESLARQTDVEFQLWVVDNSSDSRAIDVARAQCARLGLSGVVFIKNAVNVGVAAANNQGIRAALDAGVAHVVLLNNDIEFHDAGLLAGVLRVAEEQGERAVVPKMLYHDSGRIWYAGGVFQRWKGINLHVGDGAEDAPRFDRPAYTEYAPTCFLLVSREVFEAIGVMDERYFVYYDDTDFAWRLNRAGYRIRYEPRFVISHKVSSSTGGALTPFAVRYYTRNRLLFILKNFPLSLCLVALPVTALSFVKQWFQYDSSLRAALWRGIVEGVAIRRSARVAR